MNDSFPPFHRIVRLALLYSLPALAVFAVLGATGILTATVSVIGYGATLFSVGLIAMRHARDCIRLETYLTDLIGDPSLRPPAIASQTMAPLGSAIARFARHVLQHSEQIENQAATNAAILDALPDPLLVLDATRRILSANQTALDILGADLAGRDLSTALRYPKLLQAVDDAIAGHGASEIEFEMTDGRIERHLAGRVIGLGAEADSDRVIVVALNDLTLAKRSDQMRADFVANVSHELRTPLASLSGFIETLQGPARDDAGARENFLKIMSEQASRMNHLVDDLLSLSKIELSEHTPPSDVVEVGEVVTAVIDAMLPQAKARSVVLNWHAPGESCPVVGDRDQLAQVFRNLVDNAIKYGREESAVDIAAEIETTEPAGADNGTVAVSVSDRGPGIAREHLPRLTERFYRVDAGRSRALGGTGLGLAIVKHILNRHRGTLSIDSDIDDGSCFTVVLPIAANEGDTRPIT